MAEPKGHCCGDSSSTGDAKKAASTQAGDGSGTSWSQGPEIEGVIERLHKRIDRSEDRTTGAAVLIVGSAGTFSLLLVAVVDVVLPRNMTLRNLNEAYLLVFFASMFLAVFFAVACLYPLKVNRMEGRIVEGYAETRLSRQNYRELLASEANEAQSRQENIQFRSKLLVASACFFLVGVGASFFVIRDAALL